MPGAFVDRRANFANKSLGEVFLVSYDDMIISVGLLLHASYHSYQTVFRLALVLVTKLEQQLSHMATEAYCSRDTTILCKVW